MAQIPSLYELAREVVAKMCLSNESEGLAGRYYGGLFGERDDNDNSNDNCNDNTNGKADGEADGEADGGGDGEGNGEADGQGHGEGDREADGEAVPRRVEDRYPNCVIYPERPAPGDDDEWSDGWSDGWSTITTLEAR